MSSLWTKHRSNFHILKSPSPTRKRVNLSILLSQVRTYITTSIKGISLFACGQSSIPSSMPASMTVEASLLLPMFIFFFLHLAGVMEMLRFHGRMETALWNTGGQAAVFADTFSDEVEALPDAALSYLLAHGQIRSFLGEEYLESSPVSGGASGLNYLRSDYLNNEDCVDIMVTYQVRPWISAFPLPYRRMYNRYYGRAWTGYDVTAKEEDIRYVYVTEHGRVWHMRMDCSYIYHNVEMVPEDRIRDRRNQEGKSYMPCSFCRRNAGIGLVYITDDGEKYHYIRNCTAIYKDVRAVVWRENLPYRACSRCGKDGEKYR